MNLWAQLCIFCAVLFIFLRINQSNAKNCDLFEGSWVTDSSSPLYNSKSCPFIEREFNCQNNGRSDTLYLQYKWQPHTCKLPRFDGQHFLQRFEGKSIMFVGDSLSRNQWQSLTCLLYTALPSTKYNVSRVGDVSTFTFADFDVKVMLDRNVYLVDVVKEANGRILKLDSIEGGKLWNGIDMLIFNTWHWWNRRGATQPWDYIQVGQQLYKDMDRVVAFEKALNTWAKWVDTNIDPAKTKVFFQGISPSHYNGSTWGEPIAKSCVGQKEPLTGSTYPGGLPYALTVLKKVLGSMKKPVTLLDITNLSLLRKDGHPSIYGLEGKKGMDCSHWCLTGVPDTWNQILYSLILETINITGSHLDELKHLQSIAKRPRVVSLISNEMEKLSIDAASVPAMQPPVSATRTPTPTPPTPNPSVPNVVPNPALNYVPLGSFSWDQDNDQVKIYIPLEGVEQEKLETEFKRSSFDIKFHDVQGKNYRCAIPKLNKEIVPEKCKVVVKPKRVIVTLVKASKGNWLDLHFKEDKMKPNLDKERDPMAGIMDLMKNMYEEGDDDMKQTIAKAWTDARSGKSSDSLKGFP